MSDLVHNPKHYQGNGIECIEAMEAMAGKEYFVAHCRLTAMKYIWRTGKKEDAIMDIEKAIWYLDRAVKALKKE